MNLPPINEVLCRKFSKKGGKKPTWEARHPNHPEVCGVGNTADNCLRDWRKQYKAYLKTLT